MSRVMMSKTNSGPSSQAYNQLTQSHTVAVLFVWVLVYSDINSGTLQHCNNNARGYNLLQVIVMS